MAAEYVVSEGENRVFEEHGQVCGASPDLATSLKALSRSDCPNNTLMKQILRNNMS